jgi:hypothetical protein
MNPPEDPQESGRTAESPIGQGRAQSRYRPKRGNWAALYRQEKAM